MSSPSSPSSSGNEEQISWFPVPAEDELPENLQGLFRKVREKLGFVPNVFRVYSFRPERLGTWFAHFKQLHEPTDNLNAAEREMIAVAVSMANGCLYCLVAHGAVLRQLLGDPVRADRITIDYKRAGLDPKMEAVLDFAVKLTRTPHDCLEADKKHLMSFGLTVQEVWDVIEIAAMYNFTNRMASATGMMPNREYHALAR
ncbi:MAG: peroxidase-related enzyme [Acidobacteria bacterium]|nr:peroxidase-related enzyme [Acidobacteriota bacterium]